MLNKALRSKHTSSNASHTQCQISKPLSNKHKNIYTPNATLTCCFN